MFWFLDPESLAANPLMSAVGLVWFGFIIWMLADAYNRGVEYYWFWIIIGFQPVGVLAYFLIVYLRGFRLPRAGAVGGGWQRKLSLDELRYRAERSPTVMNRLALAERLMEKGAHQEAVPLLEAILAMEQGYCP